LSKLYVDEVHSKTGSTKALEIDNDGIVSTSQLQYITLLRNAQATYSAGATITGWRLADSNGIIESNGVCTVSVAGVYLISFSVISNSSSGMEFYVNGVRQFRASYGAIGTGEAWSTLANCFAWNLSASDTIHFKAENSMEIYGATDNFTVGSWSIVKIG